MSRSLFQTASRRVRRGITSGTGRRRSGRRRAGIWPLLLCALVLSQAASAEIFCVRTASQLQSALNQAATNEEHNWIRLARGIFRSTNSGYPEGFRHESAADRTLDISGGWSPVDCSTQTMDPRGTHLHGNGQRRVLHIVVGSTNGNARVRLHNLSITDGFIGANLEAGAGAQILFPSGRRGSAQIDRVIFRDNVAEGAASSGAALVFSGEADLSIRSSLFHHNSSANSAAMELTVVGSNSVAMLMNNTIAANLAHNPGGIHPSAAVLMKGAAQFRLYNNLIHGNTASSVETAALVRYSSDPVLGQHNSIESSSLVWTPESNGNIAVTPVFAGRVDDFRLRGDSPLRNAGFALHPVLIGVLELGGGARVLDGVIDIGAYESDVLFDSGFGDP